MGDRVIESVGRVAAAGIGLLCNPATCLSLETAEARRLVESVADFRGVSKEAVLTYVNEQREARSPRCGLAGAAEPGGMEHGL